MSNVPPRAALSPGAARPRADGALALVVIGLLSDRFQDLGTAFVLVALMFLVAGVLWLAGARHLQSDMDARQPSSAAAGG